jgi:exo-beta-1,3-glucanase (GH17 family)
VSPQDVAEAVDLVGIHLLPYWDDPTPTTIDKAAGATAHT